MAERNVTLRLRAVTDQYKRAMQESAQATTKLVDSAGGLDRIGGKMQKVGGTMTKSLTLPLVAAGAAGVKLSLDFEKSFAKITGLVGVASEDIGELKDGVMALAGQTGKAPQELADALFTVTSAGFRSAEAMDVLEMAAKASAAGLGETNTIAQALTGAINAYGPAVLNAADATDILVATARAGNFESSQLAGVLGKITPFAKQAGASLEDVGGSIALLTRVNNNATESGTQVAAMLRAFVVPSEEAKTALADLYGSTQNFRDIIGERGLVAALQDLDDRLGGNREQLGKILGSSEAASAAFQILEADAATLDDTFGTVGDATGMLDSAFGSMAETAGFKNAQAFAKLQTALIQVGDVLIPLIADVAEFAAVFLDAFSSLPGPVQTSVIALGGLLAAVGPLMSVGGKLVQNWKTVGRGFDRAATGAYDAAGGIGKLGKVIGGLAIAAIVYEFHQWADAMSAINTEARKLEGVGIDVLEETLTDIIQAGFGRARGAKPEALNQITEALTRMAQESPAVVEQLIAVAETADGRLARAMEQAGVSVGDLQAALDAGIETQVAASEVQDRSAEIIEEATGATEDYADANAEAVDPVQELEDAIKGVTSAMRSQLDPIWATQDALDGHKEAQDKLKGAQMTAAAAQQALNAAIAEHGVGSAEATEATWKLTEAENAVDEASRKVVRSALEVAVATTELKTRVAEGNVELEEAEAQLREWVAQGLITEEQAWNTAEELRGTAAAADELGQKNIVVPVGMDKSDFDAKFASLKRQLAELDDVEVTSLIARDQAHVGRFDKKVGGPVPGPKGAPVRGTAHGGEFILSADVVDAIKYGRPTQGLDGSVSSPSTSSNVDNRQHNITVIAPPGAVKDERSVIRELRSAQYLSGV